MKASELKTQMESLWKETFGDSSDYVALIFESYFNPDRVVYREEKGEIVAALMGVPYAFAAGRTNGKSEKLKGLYLCGLSTKKEYRHKGIMTSLIEQINERAKENGYDFTFLIPADEGLQRYYEDRGFLKSFYKIRKNYVKGHNFGGNTAVRVKKLIKSETDYKGGNDGMPFVDTIKNDILTFLLLHGNKAFNRKDSYQLQHTRQDWEIVCQEALISDDTIYIGVVEGKIVGVAFTRNEQSSENIENGHILIKKLVATESDIEQAMMREVARENPKSGITIVRDLDEVVDNCEDQLWSPFYARNNQQTAEYEDIAEVEEPYNPSLSGYPYGMVRVLNERSLVLKICDQLPDDLEIFNSQDELLRLILRRPQGERNDVLDKILDLPELSLNISLLLE